MTKFVLHVSAAHALLADGVEVAGHHQLFAPTLLRSQLLSGLHEAVRRGDLAPEDAQDRLARFRMLPIRLLGDSVLQRTAWRIADRLDWDSTYDAEYLALTQLQGDALVTLDPWLAGAAEGLVRVAGLDELRD
jgi:predicted nucleic acid-binding protein